MKSVFKSYSDEGEKVEVLKGIDLKVEEGALVVVMGPSGWTSTYGPVALPLVLFSSPVPLTPPDFGG